METLDIPPPPPPGEGLKETLHKGKTKLYLTSET